MNEKNLKLLKEFVKKRKEQEEFRKTLSEYDIVDEDAKSILKDTH